VVQRAQEWNQIPDVALSIRSIQVFGAYVTDLETTGTIEFLVRIERRLGFGLSAAEKSRDVATKLAESKGWATPRKSSDIVDFWHVSMHRFLKARQPAISFSTRDPLKPVADSKTVFSA
jgi:hypothetical protein